VVARDQDDLADALAPQLGALDCVADGLRRRPFENVHADVFVGQDERPSVLRAGSAPEQCRN